MIISHSICESDVFFIKYNIFYVIFFYFHLIEFGTIALDGWRRNIDFIRSLAIHRFDSEMYSIFLMNRKLVSNLFTSRNHFIYVFSLSHVEFISTYSDWGQAQPPFKWIFRQSVRCTTKPTSNKKEYEISSQSKRFVSIAYIWDRPISRGLCADM